MLASGIKKMDVFHIRVPIPKALTRYTLPKKNPIGLDSMNQENSNLSIKAVIIPLTLSRNYGDKKNTNFFATNDQETPN